MFFAGMALGIVAGAAFGIGIMCCVVAGKQEDQQMEQMRIRRQKKGELKTIHFRDREGIERFSLSDGESLCMMAEDGTKEIGLSRSYTLRSYGFIFYHISQFLITSL